MSPNTPDLPEKYCPVCGAKVDTLLVILDLVGDDGEGIYVCPECENWNRVRWLCAEPPYPS